MPSNDSGKRDGRGDDGLRRRRRRLAELFGDVLPETTSDDRADHPAGDTAAAETEREYLRNRPPHYDR